MTHKIIDNLDHEPMLISTNRWEGKEGTPYDLVPQESQIAKCQKEGWISLTDIVNQSGLPNGSSGFILNRKVSDDFYDSIPQERIIADDPVLANRTVLIGNCYISSTPVYYCRTTNYSASGGGVSGKG